MSQKLVILNFADAKVTFHEIDDTQIEDVELYISEELGLNLDECQFMHGENIKVELLTDDEKRTVDSAFDIYGEDINDRESDVMSSKEKKEAGELMDSVERKLQLNIRS